MVYDNDAMRNKKLRIVPRKIFDDTPGRKIMEDAVVNRYNGFLEIIPKRREIIRRRCI